MSKVISYVGSLIGSFTLLHVTHADTFLNQLDPAIDIVAVIAILVFSGALLWEGTKTLTNRS